MQYNKPWPIKKKIIRPDLRHWTFKLRRRSLWKPYFENPCCLRHLLSLLLQIITSAVVLAVSLLLGTISLMGLSQGDREQRGYEALSRAAVTGLTDELPPPAGLEDSQQLQIGASPACSTDSGTKCIRLYFLQWSLCCFCCMWVQSDKKKSFPLSRQTSTASLLSRLYLTWLPAHSGSSQMVSSSSYSFLLPTPIWKIFILKNIKILMTCISSSPPAGHSGALCEEQQHQGASYSEQPLNLPPPGPPSTDDRQTLRHALLSLLLSVSLLAVRMLTLASGYQSSRERIIFTTKIIKIIILIKSGPNMYVCRTCPAAFGGSSTKIQEDFTLNFSSSAL